MNKILLVLILLTVQSAVRAQSGQGFVITGKLENAENGKIIFNYRDPVSNNKLIFDSVECRDGNFEIRSSMPADQAVILVLRLIGLPSENKGPLPTLRLFVRNGDAITVHGDAPDLEWAEVKGNVYNDQFNQLKAVIKEDKMAMKDVGDRWAKNNFDSEGKEQLKKMGDALQEKELAFARQHPDYLVSSLLLAIDAHPTAEQRELIFATFTPEVKKGQYGRLIQEQIDEEKKSGTGATSIGFTKLDMTGKPVSLSDYKGKYVLLDFWGSWCGPCRMGNPHLKELYEKYKSKGFTIIGIANEQGPSLEANKVSWKKAVQEDGLPWIQVLNNEGIDKCNVADLYNVNAFPTKILIDPDGKIIGRFMGTASSPTEKDELTGKLNEVMGM